MTVSTYPCHCFMVSHDSKSLGKVQVLDVFPYLSHKAFNDIANLGTSDSPRMAGVDGDVIGGG